jgi:hypothetical protein
MSWFCGAMCCAGNCLCHAINNIFEDSKKISPKLFSRIGFIILSLICVGFSLLILFFGAPLLKPFNSFIQCPEPNSDDLSNCIGISSVYRMSMALLILHLAVILFSLTSNKCAKVFNIDCWSFKVLFVFGVYFGLFFVPNSIFAYYAEVSRYLSIVFLLYQVLVSISFAHIINIKLVEGLDKANDNGGKGAFKYKFWLITLSVIFAVGTLYWLISCFSDFTFMRLLIVGLTTLSGISFTTLSITDMVTRKRLLTSLYLFSYIAYLCWSAFQSEPTNTTGTIEINFWDLFFGLGYLFLALCFLGFYVKKKPVSSDTEEQKAINKNPLLEEEQDSKYSLNIARDQENRLLDNNNNKEDELDISTAYIFFQVFMMFMSVYYCMLLTNWNIVDVNTSEVITHTWASFWIKISVLFSTVILYTWVLLAPRILPDREFEF